MRTLTAIALIACLALSQAASVTFTSYDTSAACTAGTASTVATTNKLQAVTGALTLDACTQISTSGKYIKVSGTATAPTAAKTYGQSTCVVATGTDVGTATSGCYAVTSANSDVFASGTPSVKVTIASSGAAPTITTFTDASCTNAASDTSVNKFYAASITSPTASGDCIKVNSFYYSIVYSGTTVSSFKTYGADSKCGASTDVITTGTTLAYATCLPLNPSNTDVAASSTAPYVKAVYSATSAANLSVCIAAFFALLVAALF